MKDASFSSSISYVLPVLHSSSSNRINSPLSSLACLSIHIPSSSGTSSFPAADQPHQKSKSSLPLSTKHLFPPCCFLKFSSYRPAANHPSVRRKLIPWLSSKNSLLYTSIHAWNISLLICNAAGRPNLDSETNSSSQTKDPSTSETQTSNQLHSLPKHELDMPRPLLSIHGQSQNQNVEDKTASVSVSASTSSHLPASSPPSGKDRTESKDLPGARQIYDFLKKPKVEIMSGVMILVSCTIYALETYKFDEPILMAFSIGESILSGIFLVEYFARFYSRNCNPRFLFTRNMIVDFIALLPVFLSGVLQEHNTIGIRVIRLLRVSRILRLQRVLQSKTLENLLGRKIPDSFMRETEIVVTILTLLYMSSALVYEVEHPINPYFSNFSDGMYFTIVTLSTVGFGDMTPASSAGRFVVSLTILIGALVVPYQLSRLAQTYLGDMMSSQDQKNSAKYQIPMELTKLYDALDTEKFANVPCSRCNAKAHQKDAKFCRICGYSLDTSLKG